jgi:hypothetical protein
MIRKNFCCLFIKKMLAKRVSGLFPEVHPAETQLPMPFRRSEISPKYYFIECHFVERKFHRMDILPKDSAEFNSPNGHFVKSTFYKIFIAQITNSLTNFIKYIFSSEYYPFNIQVTHINCYITNSQFLKIYTKASN